MGHLPARTTLPAAGPTSTSTSTSSVRLRVVRARGRPRGLSPGQAWKPCTGEGTTSLGTPESRRGALPGEEEKGARRPTLLFEQGSTCTSPLPLQTHERSSLSALCLPACLPWTSCASPLPDVSRMPCPAPSCRFTTPDGADDISCRCATWSGLGGGSPIGAL